MEQIFFSVNALAAIFGWLAFNFIVFSSFKDENEQTFNLNEYAKKHWDNWLGSLFSIPAFLYLGSQGFNFEQFGVDGFKWSDGYYVASGFAFEAVKISWKKWKTSKE